MRKLLLIAVAALLAFRGGRGFADKIEQSETTGRGARKHASRLGISDILSLALAPPWLRSAMLLKAVSTQRRRPR